MSELPPCDPEIFRSGLGICVFHTRAVVAEEWVKKVAELSGQRIDWHYSGGMVNVLYIGDYARVRAAIEQLKPELDRASEALSGHPAELFRILHNGSHGLYRAGDELPEGAIGVDTTGIT